jgi:flagellar protein FlaF
MGFSVSGATVLLLLGFLVAGLTLAAALEEVSEARNAGVNAEEQRILEQLNTDLNVTDAVYNKTNDTLTVIAQNSGSVTLDIADTDLLVDGQFANTSAVAVGGNPGRALWTPRTNASITLDSVTAQPSRIKLVTETGVAAVQTRITVIP